VLLIAAGVSLGFLLFTFPGHVAGGLHLRIIVVDSPNKTSQILNVLDRGEDFATIARQNSSDPSANKGGDLGTMQIEDGPPSLQAILEKNWKIEMTGIYPLAFCVDMQRHRTPLGASSLSSGLRSVVVSQYCAEFDDS